VIYATTDEGFLVLRIGQSLSENCRRESDEKGSAARRRPMAAREA
jgi:hypothetical protein